MLISDYYFAVVSILQDFISNMGNCSSKPKKVTIDDDDRQVKIVAKKDDILEDIEQVVETINNPNFTDIKSVNQMIRDYNTNI